MPLGGAIVKTDWLRFYEPGEQPADFWQIIQSWDTANKSGELNDYNVCTTGGTVDQTYYLLDVCRKRLNFPDLKREVARLAERYSPHTILVEDKASGTQLIQDLTNEGRYELTPYSPPAAPTRSCGCMRRRPCSRTARCCCPKRPWLHEYIAEITGFPGTRYADQVDSTNLRDQDIRRG
jgi:predicted phage terminase large subunit-like protein